MCLSLNFPKTKIDHNSLRYTTIYSYHTRKTGGLLVECQITHWSVYFRCSRNITTAPQNGLWMNWRWTSVWVSLQVRSDLMLVLCKRVLFSLKWCENEILISFGDEAKNQQFDDHTEIKPYITFFFLSSREFLWRRPWNLGACYRGYSWLSFLCRGVLT